MDKILSVNKVIEEIINTKSNTYSRYGPECWYIRIGESQEPVFQTDELESTYQLWKATQPKQDRISSKNKVADDKIKELKLENVVIKAKNKKLLVALKTISKLNYGEWVDLFHAATDIADKAIEENQ